MNGNVERVARKNRDRTRESASREAITQEKNNYKSVTRLSIESSEMRGKVAY